ncbi:MAG: serine/threonine protein kinase [Myxococcales bacterium]|nr:serine/threonine protein kinase [Myxococcales bacterium]
MIPQSPENSEQQLGSVGRYRLTRAIASGGMATVYHALAEGIGGFTREFAVKVCDPVLARDGEFARMFLEEARLSARIHHPNVVATHDVGQDRSLYLVMDFVRGCRLSALMAALARAPGGAEQVPLNIVARILLDVLAGLEAAHSARDSDGTCLGIVHRDVSPQNVLVGFDGMVRVSDFGIARAASCAIHTRRGVVKGKVGYMAPEQVTGDPISRATDIFAVGIVAWELLTGGRLFAVKTPFEFMGRVLKDEIPLPSRFRPEVPQALDLVVRRALHKQSRERYQDAPSLARALLGALPPPATREELAGFMQWVLARAAGVRSTESAGTAMIEPMAHADADDVATVPNAEFDESLRTTPEALALPAGVAHEPAVVARPSSPPLSNAHAHADESARSELSSMGSARSRSISSMVATVLGWVGFCVGTVGASFALVVFLLTRGAEANTQRRPVVEVAPAAASVPQTVVTTPLSVPVLTDAVNPGTERSGMRRGRRTRRDH